MDILNKLLKENAGGAGEVESMIYQVLKQRHFRETVQLAAQHERQKEITIEEERCAIKSDRLAKREEIVSKQEMEIIELITKSTSMPNSELAKLKLKIKKEHKKQLAEYDKKTQEILEEVVSKVIPDMEIRYSEKVLSLREKQIKEIANAMEEMSPEEALVQSYQEEADKAAKEAEKYRKEVINAGEKKLAAMKEERRKREESRKQAREQQLHELEAEIEREKQKDLQRQQQLKERYDLIQKQRLAEQEDMHKNALKSMNGMTEHEKQVHVHAFFCKVGVPLKTITLCEQSTYRFEYPLHQ